MGGRYRLWKEEQAGRATGAAARVRGEGMRKQGKASVGWEAKGRDDAAASKRRRRR